MANMPDINKVTTFVRMPVELMAKLRSLAKERKMTLTQLVNFIMHEQLDGRPLTVEDIEWIRKEVAKNEARRK